MVLLRARHDDFSARFRPQTCKSTEFHDGSRRDGQRDTVRYNDVVSNQMRLGRIPCLIRRQPTAMDGYGIVVQHDDARRPHGAEFVQTHVIPAVRPRFRIDAFRVFDGRLRLAGHQHGNAYLIVIASLGDTHRSLCEHAAQITPCVQISI